MASEEETDKGLQGSASWHGQTCDGKLARLSSGQVTEEALGMSLEMEWEREMESRQAKMGEQEGMWQEERHEDKGSRQTQRTWDGSVGHQAGGGQWYCENQCV